MKVKPSLARRASYEMPSTKKLPQEGILREHHVLGME